MSIQKNEHGKIVQNPYKMPETIFDGYAYHQYKQYISSNGEIKRYLRCKCYSKGCPGKGTLNGKGEFTMTHDHINNICEDAFREEKAQFRQKLFSRTRMDPGTPKDIYDKEAKNHQVAAQLLGYPTMKSAIMNWRKGLQPSVPKHIADLAECLQNDMWTAKLTYQLSFANSTTGGIETSDHTIEPYGVQIRKGATIEAHVVLGCTTFAAELMDAKLAFLDCTFNVVPNINGATQLLTVMVEHCGQYFPIAFALMSRKTEEAYAAVLQCMAQIVMPFFKPETVVTDFETALQNAAANIFTEAQLHGCYFHHKQALLRRRQFKPSMLRVKSRFPDLVPEANAFVRDLMDLCLLPPQFIPEAFQVIDRNLQILYPELALIFTDLREHYKRFWINGKGPALYSQYRKKIRTNNPLERWHRKFKAAAATKPEVSKFMKVLKELVESAHLDLLTLKHGVLPHRKPSHATEHREEVLNRAWDRLGDLSICGKEERERRYINFLIEVAPRTRGAESENEEVRDYEEVAVVVNP